MEEQDTSHPSRTPRSPLRQGGERLLPMFSSASTDSSGSGELPPTSLQPLEQHRGVVVDSAHFTGAATSGRATPPSGPQVPKKRKQVRKACLACRHAKAACSEQRPCTRCVSLGMVDACVDVPRKKRRAARKTTSTERLGESGVGVVAPGYGRDSRSMQWSSQLPSIEATGMIGDDGRSPLIGEGMRPTFAVEHSVEHKFRQLHPHGKLVNIASLSDAGGVVEPQQAQSKGQFQCVWKFEKDGLLLSSAEGMFEDLVEAGNVYLHHVVAPPHAGFFAAAFDQTLALGAQCRGFLARIDLFVRGELLPVLISADLGYTPEGAPDMLLTAANVLEHPGRYSEIIWSGRVETDTGLVHVPIFYAVSEAHGPAPEHAEDVGTVLHTTVVEPARTRMLPPLPIRREGETSEGDAQRTPMVLGSEPSGWERDGVDEGSGE